MIQGGVSVNFETEIVNFETKIGFVTENLITFAAR